MNILKALFLIATPAIVVVGLFLFSNKPNDRINGFERKKLQHFTKPIVLRHTSSNIAEVIGCSKDRIYYKGRTASFISSSGMDLKEDQAIELSLPRESGYFRHFKTFLQDSVLMLLNSNPPFVLRYNLTNKDVDTFPGILPSFSRMAMISPTSFVIKSFQEQLAHEIFIKGSFNNPKEVIKADHMEKIRDGGFATDGMLLYDPSLKQLIYVYYYKNKFICLDTNLNLAGSWKTIDTCSAFTSHGKSLIRNGKL